MKSFIFKPDRPVLNFTKKKYQASSFSLSALALSACGGGGETTSSAVTTPSFSLIGTSSQGNSLSVDLSNLVENSDTVNASYEWYRDDVLVSDRVDTEPETYELRQEDVGSKVHVVVNLTSTNDNLE